MSGKILEMILSFPFKQLGEVLRKLSLSSDAGNIGAWMLYVGICLIPTSIFVAKFAKKKNQKEDLLLPVISIVLFYVMYIMVNPSLALDTNYLIDEYIGYGAFGGIVYSAVLGYLVLKLIRKFKGAEQKNMCKWLNMLLGTLIIILVINMIVGIEGLLGNIKSVNENNYDEFAEIYESLSDIDAVSDLGYTSYEYSGLGINVNELVNSTEIFLILRYIVSIIPCITAIIVMVMVQRFLKEYGKSGVSDETIKSGNMVSNVAIKAVIINVLANIGFNILQMIFFKDLLNTYTKVEFPLISLMFILAMPLITKLITTSKEIKEENEMFV